MGPTPELGNEGLWQWGPASLWVIPKHTQVGGTPDVSNASNKFTILKQAIFSFSSLISYPRLDFYALFLPNKRYGKFITYKIKYIGLSNSVKITNLIL